MAKKIVKPIPARDYSARKSSNAQLWQNSQYLSKNLDMNISYFKNSFNQDTDIVYRYFTLYDKKVRAAIILVDSLVNKESIQKNLLRPLMNGDYPNGGIKDLFAVIKNNLLAMEDIREENQLDQLKDSILNGNVVLLIDGYDTAIIVSAQRWDMRVVEEPISEAAVRGSREGFNENLKTNIALIRRRLRTPQLKIENLKVGTLSKTNIAIAYIQGVASEDMVNEVKSRIKRIQIDGVLESKYIEELIEDAPTSPFPTVEYTERPDKVAASLLEGRIAIITDNTPFVLIVPAVLFQFLQSTEDYYQHYIVITPLRWIRIFALFISLFLPSIYIAATTFHPEMIPPPLAIAIAAQREGVPFPALIEALLMEISFEFLREAGIRLPKVIGQAVSIVGALIIGDAAVSASIVSPAMVIVVAFTGIASFIAPSFAFGFTIRLLRFPIMLIAGIFGFYGIMLSAIALMLHLASLRSFGVPYLSPIAPTNVSDLKDTLVRAPWWDMKSRPTHISEKNVKRQADHMKPQPDHGDDHQ